MVLAAVGVLIVLGGTALIVLSPSKDLPTNTEVAAAPATATRAVGAAQYPPIRVAIADLGIDAEVDPVDTGAGGVLDPPEDVSRAGWWLPGARPVGPGSTVIIGHVDSRTQGQGVFYPLRTVELGSRVEVETAGGVIEYVVTERAEYEKTQLSDELFSISGERRLVLITCGGEFDSATGNYEHNVVVVATPL